jgi:hypothetical protein
MINSVRNTVMAVLNKNNYGYISPSDFNLYAKDAQIELYEEYFSNYNKLVSIENVRGSGTDYADQLKTFAEVLDTFMVADFLQPVLSPNVTFVPIGGKFFAPNINSQFGDAYMLNRLTCWKELAAGKDNNVSGVLNDPTKNFSALGVKPGDFAVSIGPSGGPYAFTTVSSITTFLSPNDTIVPNDNYFGTGDNYRVFSSTIGYDAERVTYSNIRMLNSSMLTKPNTLFPAYTQEETFLNYSPTQKTAKTITIYPDTVSDYGALYCTYFRYPKDPKWTYISLSGGEPAFNSSAIDYQDFELPIEDEYKLVMKILQYCGVSIREIQVAQFGIAQEQHEQPTFSMKQ